VKVGDGSVLPCRERDELMACAFDDCERDKIARHYGVVSDCRSGRRKSNMSCRHRANLLIVKVVMEADYRTEYSRNVFSSNTTKYHGGLNYHKAVPGSDCPDGVVASIFA
jgi:hypothetical protein